MRNIAPELFNDDFIGSQSWRLFKLWIGLIAKVADDQGRLLDKPLSIRASIFFPTEKITAADVDADLKLLNKKKKIMRYQAKDGKDIIQIVNWWKYQIGARWASRSELPAPPKWMDRIRCHEKGSGRNIVIENWDQPGGFVKPLYSRSKATVQAVDSREHEADVEADIEGKQASGIDSKEKPAAALSISSLDMDQKKAVTWMKPVLVASGVNGKMLENVLYQVATRSLNGGLQQYVLGNIALVYADERKKNKPVIIAMRLEQNEQPDPNYLKPSSWVSIPKPILRAAQIDLDELLGRKIYKASEHPEQKRTPMPDEVRERLRGLAKRKEVRK